MQHAIRDRIGAEALEHPVTDLRMTLEQLSLVFRQSVRLAEDLVRHGELADIVKSARDAYDLDVVRLEAEARRDPLRESGDTSGMAIRVCVTCVDGSRQAVRRLDPRCAVGAARELLQVGELDHLRAVRVDAVL